jgi:hypothetical protein
MVGVANECMALSSSRLPSCSSMHNPSALEEDPATWAPVPPCLVTFPKPSNASFQANRDNKHLCMAANPQGPTPCTPEFRQEDGMHAHGEQPIISEDPTLPIVSPDAPGQCSSPRLPQLGQSQGTHKTYLQALTSASTALNPPPSFVSAQPKSILSLEGCCFRCLSTTHYRKECREPLRCKACQRYGHSSDSCRSTPIPHSIVLNPYSNPSPSGAKVMEFNTDLLAGLDQHDEEITAPPVLHHPLFGA